MSDSSDLLVFFLHFLMLSFLAVGGFSAVLPEMHRFMVENHHWISSQDFAAAYAIAQLAPGPNAMYVTLLGWKAGGWAGAIAATIAMLAPVATITIWAAHMHTRNPNAPFAQALRRGLAPVALGLFLAGAWILVNSINTGWHGYILTLVAIVVVLRTKLNPLWFLATGALAGMAGFV